MPSVASEPNAVLPARPYPQSVRSQPADAQASSPFAELLDSAATPAEPLPVRSTQPERPDRADTPKPADDGTAEAASAQASTEGQGPAADSTASPNVSADSTQTAPPVDDKAAARAIEIKLSAAVAEAAAKADADGAAKAEADKALDATAADADATVLAAVVVMVIAPQPVATAISLPVAAAAAAPVTDGAVEAKALTALQATGPQAGAAKPVQVQGDIKDKPQAKSAATVSPQAKGTAPVDPQTKDIPAAEPLTKDANESDGRTAAAPTSSDNDAPMHADADKVTAKDVRHIADLLAKPDTAAASQAPSDAAGAAKASAEAVQNLGSAQNSQLNAPILAPVAANGPAQAPAVPLAGLAVEIVTQSHAGKNHFEIRLDPPELGRIDVRLHVDRDGNVSSRLVVDRADTLDLLKRDAQGLERALQQAGLKTSDNALQFSLRQQHAFTRDDTPAQSAVQLVVPDDDAAPLEALRQGYGRLLGLGGGLDIRV